MSNLELPSHHPVSHYSDGLHRDIVPVKRPVPSYHHRPLLHQTFRNRGRASVMYLALTILPLWHHVDVNNALGIEDSQYHLLFPSGNDFVLDRPRLALLQSLFGLLLCHCCVVRILCTIDNEWRRSIARNSLLVHTRSFFISSVNSLGTHLIHFFDRLSEILT
jgi:hypothetical protein